MQHYIGELLYKGKAFDDTLPDAALMTMFCQRVRLSKRNHTYWLLESAIAVVFLPICLSNGLHKAERQVPSRCGDYYRKYGLLLLKKVSGNKL